MKNQVLSIEQMQRLQELGVDTSKASAYYYNNGLGNKIYFNNFGVLENDEIPTFTLQDMLEMMPTMVELKGNRYYLKIIRRQLWTIWYQAVNSDYIMPTTDSDLLTCAYEELCWCAENGYLKGGNNEKRD